MTYNMTGVEEANNIYGMVVALNNQINALYGNLILFSIFIVTFVAARNYGMDDSFIAASFFTAFVGAVFFFINLVPITGLIFPVMLLMISVFTKAFGW